jgi:hypothetical protein
MKIVQSFSLLKQHDKILSTSENEINNIKYMYSMLLSYLSIRKYYPDIEHILYCDSNTYEKIIKYLPYDNIIIKENRYIEEYDLWNLYKIDVIKEINEPFIHIDCDIYMYSNILNEFIYQKNYDIATIFYNKKNHIPEYLTQYIEKYKQAFNEYDLISLNELGYISGGILGINNITTIEQYLEIINKFLVLRKNYKPTLNNNGYDKLFGCIIEEYGLHLVNDKYDKNVVDLFNEFDGFLFEHAGGFVKFSDSKINEIKEMIYDEYPAYINYIKVIDNLLENGLTERTK